MSAFLFCVLSIYFFFSVCVMSWPMFVSSVTITKRHFLLLPGDASDGKKKTKNYVNLIFELMLGFVAPTIIIKAGFILNVQENTPTLLTHQHKNSQSTKINRPWRNLWLYFHSRSWFILFFALFGVYQRLRQRLAAKRVNAVTFGYCCYYWNTEKKKQVDSMRPISCNLNHKWRIFAFLV